MSAADVVRQHADLRERFVDAEFRELVWANLTRLRELPDDIGWRAVDLIRSHMGVAENFYVTEQMMPAVYRRARELPDDLPQIAVEPPTGYGFCVFEAPIWSINGMGRNESVTAMTWGTGTLLPDYSHRGKFVPGLHGRVMSTWTRIYDEEQQWVEQEFDGPARAEVARIVGPWRFTMLGGMWTEDDLGPAFPVIDEEQEAEQDRQREASGQPIPEGATREWAQRIGDLVAPEGHTVSWHRIVAALWSLMNETIPGSAAIDRREPADRATRRLAQRQRIPGMVSIIRLRREEERVDGIETGRTIGVRYHVDGFWRTLHRGTADERKVWVHEHWRGPEDAPLSMRQSVRVLVR